MSSSSSQGKKDGKAPAPAPAPATMEVEKTKNPRLRLVTKEQIDGLTQYKPMYMPEYTVPKTSKERLARAKLQDKGNLPVPMDQIDDYVANIFRQINKREERFLRERVRILNDYHTKGFAYHAEEEAYYAEEEASSTAPAPPVGNPNPAPGRRRFRPGVTKSKKAGKTKQMG